jgi:hypothetical protein
MPDAGIPPLQHAGGFIGDDGLIHITTREGPAERRPLWTVTKRGRLHP